MGNLFQPVPLLCLGWSDEPTRGSRALSLSTLSAVRRDRRDARCGDSTFSWLSPRSLLGSRRRPTRRFIRICLHPIPGYAPCQASGEDTTTFNGNTCSLSGCEYTEVDSGHYTPSKYTTPYS